MLRKKRADWVYRPNIQRGDFSGGESDALGTYEGSILNHTAGIAAAQSHVLYDSHNYFGEGPRGGLPTGAGGTQPQLTRAARAEGRRATILAVEGFVYVEPQTWVLGNLIAMGFRLGAFEQDLTGVFSLDPAYSMWLDNPGSPFEQVAHWANYRRSNQWERRVHYGFSPDGPNLVQIPIRWKGRVSLGAKECFGLYTELESTSVATRCQYWLRTLVQDES